jgi:5-methylthioadenosine/S-adenosylhomocysteine deaminase
VNYETAMPRDVDCIVHGGLVYTMDSDGTAFPDGAIAIAGDAIVATGPTAEIEKRFRAAHRIDGTRQMILPGFVNAHFHAALNFDRSHTHPANALTVSVTAPAGAAERRPPHRLSQAAREPGGVNLAQFFAMAPLLSKLPDELVYSLAMHALLPQIAAGMTSFIDGGGGAPVAIARAALDSGVRAGVGPLLFDMLRDPRQPNDPPSRCADVDVIMREADETISRVLRMHPDRVRGWYTLLTDVTASDALCRAVATASESAGLPIQSHTAAAAAQEDYSQHVFGESGVSRLARLGLISERFLGIHMGFARPEEVALIAAAHAKVVHCAGTSALTGKGIVANRRIIDMIDAGVCVALASDTPIFGTTIDEVRRAFVMHKEVWGDDRVLPASKLLRMATVDAARCAMLEGSVGVIAAGRKADLVLIDIDRPEYLGIEPLTAFALFGERAHVRTTIACGEVLFRNGEFTRVDTDKVSSDMLAAMNSMRAILGK